MPDGPGFVVSVGLKANGHSKDELFSRVLRAARPGCQRLSLTIDYHTFLSKRRIAKIKNVSLPNIFFLHHPLSTPWLESGGQQKRKSEAKSGIIQDFFRVAKYVIVKQSVSLRDLVELHIHVCEAHQVFFSSVEVFLQCLDANARTSWIYLKFAKAVANSLDRACLCR